MWEEPGCLGERSVLGPGITHMLQYHLPRWHEVKEYWGGWD